METWRPFGQFKVGVVDVEWLGSRNITVEDVDPTQHLTGRIFYPSKGNNTLFKIFEGISWIPGYQYAKGLSTFLFFRRPKGWLYWLAKQACFLLAFLFGRLQRLDLHPGAPLAQMGVRFPCVVFSHGVGGHRAVYSITCSELASQGYVVLAIEHADGTASAARLAGGKGWRLYKGLGGNDEQVQKTRNRVLEMKTGLHVLRALHKGEPLPHEMKLSDKRNPSIFFAGCLDLRCLAAVGHSYGGATTAALCAEDPLFRCGVCLDPWWQALPPESAALHAWRTKAPLLVLGSHDWNTPNINGEVLCGAERQAAVLHAAKVRRDPGERNGAGSMLLIISGSSHNTFADHLALFGENVGWVLRALGLTARLDPVLGIHLVNIAVLNFLSTHLPLAAEQRQLQTWVPSNGGGALDRIAELAMGDAGGKGRGARGPLSFLFPGRGVLNAIADNILDHILRSDVRTRKSCDKPVNKVEDARDRAGEDSKVEEERNGDKPWPLDVVTGEEMLESALPSAFPASGMPPHAPGSPSADYRTAASRVDESRFDARQRQVLRAGLGNTYADAVKQEHTDEVVALLGEVHVFKCEVHV